MSRGFLAALAAAATLPLVAGALVSGRVAHRERCDAYVPLRFGAHVVRVETSLCRR